MTKMTTGLAVGIGVGPFATKQPEGSSNALDVITSSNGAWWVVKERDGSNNLVDQTGGGRDLLLPGGSANPVLLDHAGTDYFWFPGTTGNNLSIAGLSATTTYDYTVTYSDTTTNTGSETTDGSGNLVFGNTQANFNLKKVTKIEVEPSGGGALVADVRATSADPDATTFAELISALTVTINRSSTGYKTAVVNLPLYTFATDDYLSYNDTGGFFAPAGDYSAVFVGQNGRNSNFTGTLFGTRANGNAGGWHLQIDFSGNMRHEAKDDDLTEQGINSGTDRDNTKPARFYLGGGRSATNIIVADGNNSNTAALTVDATVTGGDVWVGGDNGGTAYTEVEFIGAAFIKGTAWTAAEISDIADALITANGGTP